MPFRSEEVLRGLQEAVQRDRLAHAYLFCGRDRHQLEALAAATIGTVIEGGTESHPDVYAVRPESKSRRIKIEQIRDLEKNLQLKSYSGGYKIAVLHEVERMCLGSAEAANAFLKTLEEPPPRTLILLTSVELQLVLPTIKSRCVTLALHDGAPERSASSEWTALLEGWFSAHRPGPLRAYRRATLLTQSWQEAREAITDRLEKSWGSGDEADEDILKAAIEAEVLLNRQRSIATLQMTYWEQERDRILGGTPTQPTEIRAVRILEELNQSLLQNVEPNLAVERACLELEK